MSPLCFPKETLLWDSRYYIQLYCVFCHTYLVIEQSHCSVLLSIEEGSLFGSNVTHASAWSHTALSSALVVMYSSELGPSGPIQL